MNAALSRDSITGSVLAVVAALGFALSLVLARFSYDYGTNGMTVLLVRFALMSVLTYLWCRMRHQSLFPGSRPLVICYLMGLFYFVGIGSYLSAVAYIPVSLAVLLFYTFPLITALLVAARRRQRPKLNELLVLLVAFGGVLLALGVTSAEVRVLGVGLALVAALGVSVNLLLSESVLQKTMQGVFTFHMSISAGICAALATLATNSFSLPQAGTVGQFAFAIMLVSFMTAFLAVYASVRLLGPVPLAMMMNLEPLATILLAFAILGESMSLQQGIGAGLVIVAIVIAQSNRWRSAPR
jgi:drug/metabolite transporter (DMT)-like permease